MSQATSKLASPPPNGEDWLSLAEAEARPGAVSAATLRRWIAQGILPGYRFGPRALRIKASDLDALMQRVPTAGQDPR